MSSNVPDTALVSDEEAVKGRRRPGRRTAAPALIPLLRAPAKNEDIPESVEDDGELPAEVDRVATARGIALAIALSVPMWIVILLGMGFVLL